MKKILALVLLLSMIFALAVSSFANADELITVGIINLDPAESGYRQANVKNLMEVFTVENGYDASFVTARRPTSSLRQPEASSPPAACCWRCSSAAW